MGGGSAVIPAYFSLLLPAFKNNVEYAVWQRKKILRGSLKKKS